MIITAFCDQCVHQTNRVVVLKSNYLHLLIIFYFEHQLNYFQGFLFFHQIHYSLINY